MKGPKTVGTFILKHYRFFSVLDSTRSFCLPYNLVLLCFGINNTFSKSKYFLCEFQDWKEELLACDAEFDAEAKFGLIKSTGKIESSAKGDAMDGMTGSFRKLDV